MHQCPKFYAFIHETIRIACPVPNGAIRSSSKDIRCLKWKNKTNNKNEIIVDFIDSRVWNSKQVNDILYNKSNNNSVEYDYIIKKKSQIELNLSYILYNNKTTWNLDSDPQMLNLNYWLTKDGKFVNNKNAIPFGVGKRDCPGQRLAVNQICAFMGNLLLRYHIAAQNNNTDSIKLKYKIGGLITMVEEEIPVLIRKRD